MTLRKCPKCGRYMVSRIAPSYSRTWIVDYACGCGYTMSELAGNVQYGATSIERKEGKDD